MMIFSVLQMKAVILAPRAARAHWKQLYFIYYISLDYLCAPGDETSRAGSL